MEKPKIRFKGYQEDWEQRKLGEVCSEIGDGLHSAPEYDDNGKFYFINGNNLINGHIVINSKETKRVSEKTFEKNNKQLDDNTVLLSINGTIGNLAYYQGEPVMLGKSAAYLKANKIDKTFLYSLLQTTAVMNNFMLSLTGTTIKNLGLDAIKNTKISIPELHEQKKIGLYFSQLDNLITLHQRKCEEMKILKKYMLQKMFPQNGQLVPQIRFSGFTEDWEQRKLDDVVEFLDTMRKPLEGAKRISGPYPYYGASGIVDYVDGYLFDEELILLSEDGANITDRNYPVCFLASGKYWVNNHAHVLRTKQENENNFICNSLERKDYTQYNTGMAMPKLNKETCKKIPILCPGFEEQKKIGDYFRSLDNLITLHQQKCDELRNIKKFMLQNMFI